MLSKRTLLLVSVVACGGGSAAPAVPSEPIGTMSVAPAPPPPPPSSPSKLADARTLRDAALATPAPVPPKPNPKSVALPFVQDEVKGWYEATKPKVDRAEAAYAEALRSATSPAEREVALAERIDLLATFAERFIGAGAGSIPDEWRSDKDLAANYESSIREAASPWVTRARDLVKSCANEAAPRCADGDKRVQALEAARARVASGAPPPQPKPKPTRGGCKCAPNDPLCSCL
jgi:hypothetical protein